MTPQGRKKYGLRNGIVHALGAPTASAPSSCALVIKYTYYSASLKLRLYSVFNRVYVNFIENKR